MDKILSVIIPTYNMEKYLHRCLESLIVNNGFESLEVLVINDGSKDSSSIIAHSYESRYPNVFRVIDKGNGNYGSCINRGLKEAAGKYVKILDADDNFNTVNFESFLSAIQTIDADLIISDYVKVSEDENILEECSYRFSESGIMSFESICTSNDFLKTQMHAVTYRRKMLLDMNYVQTEGISYTDQQWIFAPMLKVKTVWHFSKPVYRYLIGRAGQTINESSAIKYAKNMIPCLRDLLKFYSDNSSAISKPLETYYLQAILIPITKGIYIDLILDYSDIAKNLLIQFDNDLKIWNNKLYTLIGSKEVSSFLGFRHIQFWRQHQNANKKLYKIFGNIYLSLIKLREAFNVK